MLNNKAQSLVIFVVCLPIFLLFIAYVFDIVNSNYEKKKVNNIMTIINTSDMEDSSKCELVYKNDKDIKCTVDESSITLEKNIKSIFGNITGRNTYKITIAKEKE